MAEDGNAAEKLDELSAMENLAASLEDDPVESIEENQSAAETPPSDGGDSKKNPENEKDRNLDLILDVPLKVTVELGRTKMVVNELLNLGQGSVVELSKLAGEPMEVFVNDKLVARGEAVVVNEKFGVRLTDIISPSERVEQLA